MKRIYIDGDESRFTYAGFNQVDLEFYNGQSHKGLEPRRLFPLSGSRKYISLLDKDLKEVALIRDLDTLMADSRKVVEQCLDEYYMLPRVLKILDRNDKFRVLSFTVLTDRGERTFEIRNRHSDIKVLYDKRVLIRDSNDNRYEIPDMTKLDKSSLKFLAAEL